MDRRARGSTVNMRTWRSTALGLAVLAILLGGVTSLVVRATDGHLTYALDDAYIHMAIARHVAFDGTWGISPDHFASASSSPLWTLLLALAFRLAGVHDVVPLIINVASAAALVVALARALDAEGFTPAEAAITTAGVLLFAPIASMVWIGMEHALSSVLVVATAVAAVELSRRSPRGRPLMLLLFTMLACATRLEGTFVAAGCALLLVTTGRVRTAAACIAAAALPVVANGLWNQAHGWYFLPASVLMKTAATGSTASASGVLQQTLSSEPPAEFLALVVVASAFLARRLWQSRTVGPDGLLVVFLVAAVLHTALARFGYLYRYESYLMVLGILAVATAAHHAADAIARTVRIVGPRDVVIVLMVVGVAAGSARTLASNGVLATTAGHIHRQQQQMARFVARYYDSDAVALNDIGAVSYGSHARVFDLAGLASLDVTRARRAGRFDAAFINAWLDAGEVPVAIVYDAWFTGTRRFADRWTRVARWVTDEQTHAVESAVTFYARTPADAVRLREQLLDFEPTLPTGVTVEWAGQPAAP